MSMTRQSFASSADLRGNGPYAAEDGFRGGPGPAGFRFALELVLNDVGIEIEEGHLFQLVIGRVFEQLLERSAGDCPSSEPRDDGIAFEHDARQSLAHAIGDDPS